MTSEQPTQDHLAGGAATIQAVPPDAVLDAAARTRLEAAVQAGQREIAALHRISELGLREQPLDQILPAVVAEVSACTGFPIVAIEFYDATRQVMTFAAATGMPLPPDPAGLVVPVDQTLSGLVARSGEALIETQAQARPEYAAETLRRLGVQTFVCVPMCVAERVIGTLALAHPESTPTDAALLRLTGSLANVIAILVARKQTEAHSAATEHQLREILDRLAAGVLLMDADGRYLFANARAATSFGLTPAEMVGKTLDDVLPPEVAQHYRERNRAFIAAQNFAEYEGTFDLAVGTRTFFIADQVLTDAQGQGYALLSSSIDITARKAAEVALRASQENLEALIENTDGSIWSVDPHYRLIVGNRLFHQHTSVALGRPLRAGESVLLPAWPQAACDEWRGFYDRAMQQGPFSIETATRFTDAPHTVEYRFSPISSTTGQPVGVTIFGRDITARKQAEAALQVALTKYQTLFESFPLGITVADATGQVVESNAMAERILGIERAEHSQRQIDGAAWRIVRPDGTPMPAEEYASVRALREQRVVENIEMGVIIPRGATTWINVTAAPLPVAGYGAVITYSDITVRKAAEAALHQALEELKRSNAELEQFAYVASHDLQEPLRAVTGMVQLLQQRYQGQLDERADQYIGLAVEAAARMQALINDLLTFSRVQRRAQPFAPIAMEAVLEAAWSNLRVAIAESGAVITHDPLPTVRADAVQLTQLLQNLLGNAIKFRSTESPRIHVSATRREGAWCFAVRDNGIGIAPEYFERIFVIFQRLHPRRAYPGTGIGLALCKKIVEHHGGQIWVESRPGDGATLCFTIPDRSVP